MKKKPLFFLFTVLFFAGFSLYGQVPALDEILDETPQEKKLIQHYVRETSLEIAAEKEEKRENLLKLLAEEKKQGVFLSHEKGITVPEHDLIQFFVQYYTTVGRPFLLRSLRQMELYYPLVEKNVTELGLPRELAVLGIIESGYTPEALSHKGAMGIWQLMPLTAKIYGLKINGLVDERMDVEKSTRAALLFLKSLSETFNGNWDLVIASYNGGGGYISSQIRNQKESDFWKLCKISGFKSETLEFVPRFYAVLHILQNPEKYDIQAPNLSKPLTFESFTTSKTMELEDVSKLTGIPDYLLEELNPHLKKGVTLPSVSLFVPRNMGKMVAERMDRYRGVSVVQGSEEGSRKTAVLSRPVENPSRRISLHRVKKSETLFGIARKYESTVEAIKKLNRLKNTRIAVGMKLRVPVSVKPSTVAFQAESQKKLSRSGVKKVEVQKVSPKTVFYRVQKGDTLFQIAERYRVKVTDLRKWNRMEGESVIIPGQRIKIQQPSGASPMVTYRVQKGDTLYSLSKKFRTPVQTILSYNDLKSEKSLWVGKVIRIPERES